MSIPVDVAELATTLADYGSGYLLTVSSAGRVKVVSAAPRFVDGSLLVTAPGSGSITNIERNPAVTLLFPPVQPGGHTLLVDGIAALPTRDDEDDRSDVDDEDDGDEERTGDRESGDAAPDVRIEPHHAVLHRPATPADTQAVDGPA
ncbi:pyridoxamine 5'-phosphate oxidase [Nocardioides ferulae]|uniref:pyridoxamine 5'-phosphate oxidase n=1 Tax=Nocardioides ferulae TaxID=2340821 RepID=UPI000EAF32BF|nr:pyridoxamine 5'-phosphate oxidase [Nocardioides ferulae]